MSSNGVLIRAATVLWAVTLTAILPERAWAQNQAESLSASFRKAAQRVSPALVGIRVASVGRPLVNVPIPQVGPFRPGDLIPRGVLPGSELEVDTLGSGFLIDSDRGLVVTTEQVLRGSSQAIVVFSDGTERPASQIRRDPRSEVALLSVDVKGLQTSAGNWGDSSALEPGDWVLALGSGSGSPPSLSAGIFSARRQGAGPVPGDHWLETDIRLTAANIGGPLVNLKGEIVGINSAFPPRRDGMGETNRVLPAERIRRIVSDLADFGQVRRGYLGVQVEPAELVRGRPARGASVVISSVGPATPAAAAGLRPGDRILSANGRPVAGLPELQSVVEVAPIGEELTLLIDRAGQRIEIKVRPQAQPGPAGPGGTVRSRIETEGDPARARNRGGERPGQPKPAQPRPAQPVPSEPDSLDPIPRPERMEEP